MRENSSRSQPLIVADLGTAAYRPTWDLQKQLQARLVKSKREEDPDPPPHLLLFVEHPPVFTLGKSGSQSNLLASRELLEARGAEFVEIDRGGDITFHGPGQLVGYPILDLDRIFTDIHRYLRFLEDVIIRTCADYGIESGRVEGRTGVWVGPDDRGYERKICAMGIRCSRWVTMHGFAFNISTDLSYFDLMVPCGIADRGVTSLEQELGASPDASEVRTRVADHFARLFEMEIVEQVDAAHALPFLHNYAVAETRQETIRVRV